MKVIAYLNELEILGAKIDAETKNHMVLNTLLDTVAQFKIDYELNKKDYTLAALMKNLQITENIFKMKKGSGSTTSKKKSLKKFVVGKGKCFHCNKNGHWKRNYKIYLDLIRKRK